MQTPQAGTESTGFAGLRGEPWLPCSPGPNTSPETSQPLLRGAGVGGSGLGHCQRAGDKRLRVRRLPWMALGKKPYPGFICNLQPNTFERAPNSGAERAEWKQGGPAGAGSAGSFRNVSPPRQGRARHSPPCFAQEMSGTAVPAYCISSEKQPQPGSLGLIRISEDKRCISQR